MSSKTNPSITFNTLSIDRTGKSSPEPSATKPKQQLQSPATIGAQQAGASGNFGDTQRRVVSPSANRPAGSQYQQQQQQVTEDSDIGQQSQQQSTSNNDANEQPQVQQFSDRDAQQTSSRLEPVNQPSTGFGGSRKEPAQAQAQSQTQTQNPIQTQTGYQQRQQAAQPTKVSNISNQGVRFEQPMEPARWSRCCRWLCWQANPLIGPIRPDRER